MALKPRDAATLGLVAVLVAVTVILGIREPAREPWSGSPQREPGSERPRGDPESQYASAILGLDSALGNYPGDFSTPDGGVRFLATWYQLGTRKLGAFDVVVPPQGFEPLHAQLSAAAREFVGLVGVALEAVAPKCVEETRAGIPCDAVTQRYVGGQRAMHAVAQLPGAREVYLQSRARAGAMLAERGITLPPPTVSMQ